MTDYIKLDAWHEDADGRRIAHEATTMTHARPRRFVSRWVEDGKWNIAVTEQPDGRFAGTLEYPGSDTPASALCDLVESSDALSVKVNASYGDEPWAFTIEGRKRVG